MGRIHGKYLTELKIPWNYHDINIGSPLTFEYSHIVISTPIETHIDVYKQLKGFGGKILIEKPAIIRKQDLFVLKDPRVSVGMSERFNSSTHVRPVRFLRIVRPSFSNLNDIAIHDLDILCQIFKLTKIPSYHHDQRTLTTHIDGVDIKIEWPQIIGERKLYCDNMCVDMRPAPNEHPIRKELSYFLSNRIRADLSHLWLIDLLRKKSS